MTGTLVDTLFVLLGFGFLVVGGEALVRGASGIALIARVTPAVVGLTIVSAGTSMPELVVSLNAALNESPGLAVGNAVGSNIFNVGAILGLTALVRPLRILGNTVRLEWPVMMLAVFQLHLLIRDGALDRLEGGFLLGALIAFVAYTVFVGARAASDRETGDLQAHVATASFGRRGGAALALNGVAVLIGALCLAGGSQTLVYGASNLARSFGVSDTVIGLTIVAAGTGTPELVTSLVAAFRERDDIAVANVLGSNIFNVLGILGTTALVFPIQVPTEIITRDSPWMIAFCLVLFPLMATGSRLRRPEGGLLLLGFLAYIGLLLRSA
ncbi:MAG: calcium/sodium antiporter [Myxococcota bacterium]